MAKKEEKKKVEVNEEELKGKVEFLKSYIRDTRKTWNDKNPQTNQLHAVMGLTTEIGELVDAYKKNVGYDAEINTANVKEEIGDIMYYAARILDELFYKYQEKMDSAASKTILDFVLDEISRLMLGGNSAIEDENSFEDIDLIATLPCYYKDIYLGMVSKDERTFNIGFLSLVANLITLCKRLNTSMEELLIANIEKLKVRYPEGFSSDDAKEENRDKIAEMKAIKTGV